MDLDFIRCIAPRELKRDSPSGCSQGPARFSSPGIRIGLDSPGRAADSNYCPCTIRDGSNQQPILPRPTRQLVFVQVGSLGGMFWSSPPIPGEELATSLGGRYYHYRLIV